MEVPKEWKEKMAMVETFFPMFLDLGSAEAQKSDDGGLLVIHLGTFLPRLGGVCY